MTDIFKQIKKLIPLRRFGLYLYIFKAVMAAILVFPFFISTNSVFSLSKMSETLLTDWDMSVFIELAGEKIDAIVPLFMFVIAGAVIYVVLTQFINGGLYYIIVSGKFEKIDWKQFFVECGMNFGTHMRITGLMLIIYMILIPASLFLVNILGAVGSSLIGTPVILIVLAKLVIILVILLAASIFSDSVRAGASAYPDKMLKEIFRIGADYFRPRLILLLKIFFITYIPFLIIWILVEYVSLQVNTLLTGFIGIFLEFILFQVSSIARTGQKLWYLVAFGRNFREQNPGRYIPEQTELKLG